MDFLKKPIVIIIAIVLTIAMAILISNIIEQIRVENLVENYQEVNPSEKLQFDIRKLLKSIKNKNFDELETMVDVTKINIQEMKNVFNVDEEYIFVEDGFTTGETNDTLQIKYIKESEFFGGIEPLKKDVIIFTIDSKSKKIINYKFEAQGNYE